VSVALLTLGEEIKAALPGAVTDAVVAFDELTVHAQADRIVEVLRTLYASPAPTIPAARSASKSSTICWRRIITGASGSRSRPTNRPRSLP
jgi:hypothetical protein